MGVKRQPRKIKQGIDYLHFRRRLWERHRIDINLSDYMSLVKAVQGTGRVYSARRIGYTTNRRSLHAIDINGREVFVVYSEAQNDLVTALPMGSESYYRWYYHIGETNER